MSAKKTNPNQMTFLEHLGELRRRIIYSLIFLGIAFCAMCFFTDRLLNIVLLPLKQVMPAGTSLIGTGVAEAFGAEMLVAGVAAVVISCPFWFYELWMFISPGLYFKEKKLVFPFVIFATLFFVGGVYFGYHFVLPVGFQFFMDQYVSVGLSPQIKVSQYLSFTTSLLMAFGGTFELPIVVFFLGRIGLVTWRTMMRTAKYAVVIIFIVAGVLTPGPDVASQILLAIPLLALYFGSILLVALTGKKKPMEKPSQLTKPDQTAKN